MDCVCIYMCTSTGVWALFEAVVSPQKYLDLSMVFYEYVVEFCSWKYVCKFYFFCFAVEDLDGEEDDDDDDGKSF